jgi:hypothetical protein
LQGSTGSTGANGQSTTFYSYKANTSAISGNPSSGYLIWNNAFQFLATEINLSSFDSSGINIDVFLSLFNVGDTFILQDRLSSSNYQVFKISSSTTIYPNLKITIPVTFLSSSGSAFSNNQDLIFAVVSSGLVGATGASGLNIVGSTGATGVGTQGSTGATGVGTQGSTGATGVGTQGSTGATGLSVIGATGASGVLINPVSSITVTNEAIFGIPIETKATPSISAGVLTLNLSSATLFYVTLNANITSILLSSPPVNPKVFSFTIQFVGDGTARTIAYPASVKWGPIGPPIPTSTLGKIDTYTLLTHDGGSNWFGFVSGQSY